jgi:choice-of-anchor B domain-containing protein
MSRLTVLFATLVFASVAFGQELALLGHTPVGGGFVCDVWEYVDSTTGSHYALVGTYGTISVVDVTDPANPSIVATIPMPGFDMKVWGKYVYGVTGGGGTNQGKIADLTNPLSPQIVGSFNSAHNIFISNNGFLFAEYPGLKIYDLNPDPLSPMLVLDHDNSDGHDATVIGDRLFDFHGGSTNIYVVSWTESFSLSLLGTIDDPGIVYHHSGWTSKDKRYLFIDDELSSGSNPDITVWDIDDPANPVRVDTYTDNNATVHNLYVIDNYAYVSYYTAGLRVFDISDPTNISMAAEYDTSPATGEGYDGAFGVYPFTSTGHIYVSDQTGLYVFSFDLPSDVGEGSPNAPASFALRQNYPNPFNPSTNIGFSVPEESHVRVAVTDLLGRQVAVLADERMEPGEYTRQWKPNGIASGLYLYTLDAGSFRETRKLMYLR